MSLSNKPEKRKSLTFRIALYYALIYIASTYLAFTGFYMIIRTTLIKEINEDIIGDVRELEILLEDEGFESLVKEINDEAEADGIENTFSRIYTHKGQILAETDLEHWKGLEIDNDIIRDISSGEKESYRILFFTLPDKEYKICTIYSLLGTDYIVQLGLVLESTSVFLSLIKNTFVILVVIIVFFSVFVALFITRRAMYGIGAVTKTAEEISKSGALDRRVDINSDYIEILSLAETFNTMLGNIQRLVTELKEINDNIAHDLKTPITRIRGHAEITLTSSSSTLKDYENMASNTIEESDNLLEIITAMLYISKVDSGIATIKKEETDLSEIVKSACDLFSPIAEDKGISINLKIPETCIFYGEQKGIQRMTANLLDNAIKYSSRGGSVYMEIIKTASEITFKISDTGIGIAEENIPFIFKRFYRCSENTDIPGIGLGLSMVQAVIKQHSGTITAESRKNVGTVFTIILPLLNA